MSLLTNGDWMVVFVKGDNLLHAPWLFKTRDEAIEAARKNGLAPGCEVLVAQVVAYGIGRSTTDWKESLP